MSGVRGDVRRGGIGDPAVRIVAEQEFRNRIGTRSWQITALILAVLVIGGCVGLHLLSDDTTTYDVGVVGAEARSAAVAIDAGEDTSVEVHDYADQAAAEAAVRDGAVEAALLPAGSTGWEVVGKDTVDPTLAGLLSSAVTQQTIEANAKAQGVDLAALTAGVGVSQRSLDPDADLAGPRRGVSFAMALLFYLVAMLYGMVIAQSVVAEKESRVVEILAAAISTRSLLWGKVLVSSGLALAQIAVLVGLAFGTLAVLGEFDLMRGLGPGLLWSVPFYGLGFVALASLWSAAGALASRNEDIGSTSLPMQVVLLGAYMISAVASGAVLVTASFVPIASALVMPSRIAQGDVPLWQILASLALNVLAAVLLVRLGALVYDRNLMQTARKRGFREALSTSS